MNGLSRSINKYFSFISHPLQKYQLILSILSPISSEPYKSTAKG